MTDNTIHISLDREMVDVDRDVYKLLFENSVVHSLSTYQKSVKNRSIRFRDFVGLARKADIPYSLFFAPREFVILSLKRKNRILLTGVTKQLFSLNSRGLVLISDIELIIKDILRKQQFLKKHDKNLPDNSLLGSLKSPRKTVH